MELLEEIRQILKEHPCKTLNPYDSFNIIEILGIDNKEVYICRLLAVLLNPNGKHDLGNSPLKLFLKNVLRLEKIEDYLENAVVITEYSIDDEERDNPRRIDIVIRNGKHFIPMEVKIEAGDQKAQTYAYYQYAYRLDPETKLYYLTKTGYMPSAYSREKADKQDVLDSSKIIPISFIDDIRSWLDSLEESKIDAVNVVIKQLKDVVSRYSVYDKDRAGKMKNLILENEENLRAAVQLADTIPAAKSQLMFDFLKDLSNAMSDIVAKYDLVEDTGYTDDDLWKACRDYYRLGKNTRPCLNYVFREPVFLAKDVVLCVKIEIYGNIYVGIVPYNLRKHEFIQLDEKLIIEAAKHLGAGLPMDNREENLFVYRYLPYGGNFWKTATTINFRDHTALYYKLVNKEERLKIISDSLDIIDDGLLAYIEH